MQGRISSLAISMVLAFFLWLNLAGQDNSLIDLTVGLQLHSLPENLLIKGEAPKEVTLRVLANAAQVRFLSDRKLSLPLDLSLAREGHNTFPVLLDSLPLPRGVEVSGVDPETIEFEAIYIFKKEVPVKPFVVGLPDPAFRLEGLVLEPAVMTVQGSPEILDRLDNLTTTPLAVEGLTEDTVFAVNAVLPHEWDVAIVGSKEITVTAKISEISTQAVFSDIPVEIEIRGREGPQGGRAHFVAQPARVSVTVSWPSSRGRPVSAGEIRAVAGVDGEQLKAEGWVTVPVVAVPPAGASVAAIQPATVNVAHVPPSAEAGKPGAKP